MKDVKVGLRPIVTNINMPTVIKTTVLPGDSVERLFIATQIGEIYYIGNGVVRTFLDIRPNILKLGTENGYDERGLLGLAFHPHFYYNGLFYLHYSAAGSQGPGTLKGRFIPNPCDPNSINQRWINRDAQYDHIDTVEEWIMSPNGQPQKRRTLLNIRRPFLNHNGVNSLNFSPETGKLVLTTGDGGSGYDPYNLSQNDMEIAGKIIEIDVSINSYAGNPPIVTRFNELPLPIQETLTVIAKGVRNISGISYQRVYDQYIKYVGNVGQDLVEAIYSFVQTKPISVPQLIQSTMINSGLDQEGFLNFGWRGWEGNFPTSIIEGCPGNQTLDRITAAYFNEAVETSARRLQPLTSYYHRDPRPDKFGGTALTGVQAYMGHNIPDLTGSVVFTDLARDEGTVPGRGVLGYTRARLDGKQNDFSVIQIDANFGAESAYFVSLGANQNQTKLYLGVYGSTNVTDYNKGTIFEIVP
ncbi:glucose dehydrogenase [Lysinibacillus yapensis]|uniref:Glucose dehydrogenase n=1 Tax=Ureibacillus yapensis TaxID=2304605 RepID=A0A396SGB1_9BACL|nr:PQQ-dependent sugar dehydrogenase [Lysinibacillus yapensis]RHW37506.1 glucose dehydrogenase [Lysinibacillus yapensis]